jgi:hypothetical protein
MPATTSVYLHDQADCRIVFAKCAELIEAPARTRTSDDGGMITTIDDGLCAWIWVEYRPDGPLRTTPVPHSEHCDPGCRNQHAPACWMEAAFDTPDGYRDDHGGPGTLHQRLIASLGRWLDGQEIRWSWRNHGDGILHDRHNGLAAIPLLDTDLGVGLHRASPR